MRKNRSSMVTRAFAVMVVVNIIMVCFGMIFQKVYLEDIYFHSKIDDLEVEVQKIKNNIRKEAEEAAEVQRHLYELHRKNGVSGIIFKDNHEIINESIFNNMDYILLKWGESSYIRVLVHDMFNMSGEPLGPLLNGEDGKNLSVRGIPIAGTDYLQGVSMEIDGVIYERAGYREQKKDIIEIRDALVVDGQFPRVYTESSSQEDILWSEVQDAVLKKESKEEMIQKIHKQKETSYLHEESGREVFYMFDYVEVGEDEYVFFAMLFVDSGNQTSLRRLSSFYLGQYIFIIFIISIIGYILGRRVRGRMRKVTEYAKDVAQGDFTTSLHIDAKDETGEISDSLKEISKNLSEKIDEINRRALEKEREEKRLRVLLSSMSHEFKTPLGIMSGFVEMISDGINQDKHPYYLNVIDQEIDGLNGLVKETLELARYESGTVKIEMEPFNIREAVYGVSQRVDGLLRDKRLESVIAVEDCWVSGDQKKIERVLENLISNAINHSKESGKIVISAEEKHREVYIYVENTGHKIPEDKLRKIWEGFYRVDESRSRSTGGSGLGLAIVSSILDIHESEKGAVNTEDGVRVFFSLKKVDMEI